MITKTVDPGGTGDYLTLAACIADADVGYDADLVTQEEILRINCITTNDAMDAGAGPAISSGTFTTDDDYYIDLRAGDGYWNQGAWPRRSGSYWLDCSTGNGPIITADYTRVTGIGIYGTGMGAYTQGLQLSGVGMFADSVFVRWSGDTYPETWAYYCNLTGATDSAYLVNCAGITERTGGSWTYAMYPGTLHATAELRCHNCTFISSYGAALIQRAAGVQIYKNCLLHGVDSNSFSGIDVTPSPDVYELGGAGFGAGTTNNVYFHAEPATGAVWNDYSKYGQDIAIGGTLLGPNLDGFFGNLQGTAHVRPGKLKSDGVDLRTDSDLPVTLDITGSTRSAQNYPGCFTPAPYKVYDSPGIAPVLRGYFGALEDALG